MRVSKLSLLQFSPGLSVTAEVRIHAQQNTHYLVFRYFICIIIEKPQETDHQSGLIVNQKEN